MENEKNNIELRSEEVQEILGHIPSRIIRYGITVIISVVLVLFIGSFFFKYPDILRAPVEVVSENPPAAIVANSNGNLSEVLVADSQEVFIGQHLAVIKNPAVLSHVEWLRTYIQQNEIYQLSDSNSWLSNIPDTLQLGDIQSVFTTFQKQALNYLLFEELNYHQKKIASLKDKKGELKKYLASMQRQVNIKEKDYEFAKSLFLRDSGLFVKDVISLADYEKSGAALLQNSLSLENARSGAINSRIQMNELDQQITELELEQLREKQNHLRLLSELEQNLESELARWYNTYVLTSPIKGAVTFNKVWSTNQYVSSGTEVFTVVPKYKSNIIGRITLPTKGAGKVKINQEVNLKFDNYPYQEFGMVNARVASISLVPSEQNYMVEVALADTLVSNYGFALPFSQKMSGTAEIITEDLPLFIRLFNPLKSLFKEHWGRK